MPQSDDLIIRRAIVGAVDRLPQPSADLRARTLARFRSEVAESAARLSAPQSPSGVAQAQDRRIDSAHRLVALTLGFLPAFVAGPVSSALGIEEPLTLREAIVGTRAIGLVSRLLRIA